MKCVILQPGYLPWLGFFDQMNKADIFVIYDDIQYTKRDWRSRNRIKTNNGICWLSVPVKTKNRKDQLIKEAEIVYDKNWMYIHLETIRRNYLKAEYFDFYFPQLKQIIEKQYKYLIDLDTELIFFLKKELGIKSHLILSSALNVTGKSTQRLVNICKKLKVDQYLTGNKAQNYIDLELFDKDKIKVIFHNYKHPIYPQLHGEFISHLSVVDLLFNCGSKSLDYLTGAIK